MLKYSTLKALQNSWLDELKTQSDQWVQGAVRPDDHWCRYQPVASWSNCLCPCTQGTLRA